MMEDKTRLELVDYPNLGVFWTEKERLKILEIKARPNRVSQHRHWKGRPKMSEAIREAVRGLLGTMSAEEIGSLFGYSGTSVRCLAKKEGRDYRVRD